MEKERIKTLNEMMSKKGKFVVYWMQSSQKARFNHALVYSIEKANELSQPLVVLFVLFENYPEANERHYAFMLDGLRDVWEQLSKRGIKFVVRIGDPVQVVTEFSKEASILVTDRGYLSTQREWDRVIAERVKCQFYQIESDVVVPVETSSPKEEYAAYTLRRKIKTLVPQFLVPLEEKTVKIKSSHLKFYSFDIRNKKRALKKMNINRSVKNLDANIGGQSEAYKKLDIFIKNGLKYYATKRKDPNFAVSSGLSAYLHFGQISPIDIALKVIEAGGEGVEEFLEELIVRRELAINFVFYNKRYRSFDSLPSWAQNTLMKHANDQRPYLYSIEEFENAKTQDVLWNACQMELLKTGKIHSFMRMYWGKKILEWTEDPVKAYKSAVYLNNKYALDGSDPNSYAGISWCFGKHDKPFKERPVYGTVRCISTDRLTKKFDVNAYIKRVNLL